MQRSELSGNESFHRHISGSSVTPGHCADWDPAPAVFQQKHILNTFKLFMKMSYSTHYVVLVLYHSG